MRKILKKIMNKIRGVPSQETTGPKNLMDAIRMNGSNKKRYDKKTI
jgi:hypothetical protein